MKNLVNKCGCGLGERTFKPSRPWYGFWINSLLKRGLTYVGKCNGCRLIVTLNTNYKLEQDNEAWNKIKDSLVIDEEAFVLKERIADNMEKDIINLVVN